MIRTAISTLLQRLTTDTGALRGRIAELESERDAALCRASDFKNQADDLCRELEDVEAERDRLRAMVGNTEPTASERLMLGIVREMPGLLAKEYGAACAKAEAVAFLAENPNAGWQRKVVDSGPDEYQIALSAKILTGLHKKGLVRREKAGNSYRYWEVTA